MVYHAQRRSGQGAGLVNRRVGVQVPAEACNFIIYFRT